MPSLLLVEDDDAFSAIAARTLRRRGFDVVTANSLASARSIVADTTPDCAIVDLRLGDESGLELLPELLASAPMCRIVVLTGYASIATAVEAVKSGATNYLTKPVDIDELVGVLQGGATTAPALPASEPMSVRRAGWEHVQRVLQEADGNISEAARRLCMHRRSLQRMLHKRPPAR
jgi:two-component system response regulator RegA